MLGHAGRIYFTLTDISFTNIVHNICTIHTVFTYHTRVLSDKPEHVKERNHMLVNTVVRNLP